jgi:hypothetical protein
MPAISQSSRFISENHWNPCSSAVSFCLSDLGDVGDDGDSPQFPDYPITQLPDLCARHPCPTPGFTQFHPRSPNVTQAGVPGKPGFALLGGRSPKATKDESPVLGGCLG